MGRRLMFSWSILSRPKTELVRQFYDTQKVFPGKYDWVSQIQLDLAESNIFLTDDQIRQMSQSQFKQLVRQRVEKLTDELIDNNRGPKMSQLGPRKFQEYLGSDQLSLRQKRILFSARTRMLPCKNNFRGKYKDLLCDLCQGHVDSQPEMLTCPSLLSDPDTQIAIASFSYDDMFGNINQQIRAAKSWCKIVETRQRMNQ